MSDKSERKIEMMLNIKNEASDLVKNMLVRGENRSKCASYCTNMLNELYPQTEIQTLLAKKIIFWGWKLQRMIAFETVFLSKQNIPDISGVDHWGGTPKIKRMRSLKKVRLDSYELKDLHSKQVSLEKLFNRGLELYRVEQERFPVKKVL